MSLNVLFKKEPKQDAPSIFFFRKKKQKSDAPLSRPSDIYTPYGRIDIGENLTLRQFLLRKTRCTLARFSFGKSV